MPEITSPDVVPPVWLAGVTPSALERTGRRYDGWLPYPPDVDTYTSGVAGVRSAALAAGRPADAVTPALFVTVLLADDVGSGRRALADYAQASYGRPLEIVETIQLLVAGPPDHVRSELDRYVAGGAEHLVIRLGALGLAAQRDQLNRVAALFG